MQCAAKPLWVRVWNPILCCSNPTQRPHPGGSLRCVLWSVLSKQNRITSFDFLALSWIFLLFACIFFLFNTLSFPCSCLVQGPAWAKRNMQSQSCLLKTDWPLPGLYCCSMPRVMGSFAFWVSLFAELFSARNINYTPRGQSNCDDAEHRTWVQFQHRCCSLSPWIPAAISLSHPMLPGRTFCTSFILPL